MRKHLFIYLSFLFIVPIFGQSGIVFRDANGNGTKETGERGAAGILVKSYINNGIGDQLFGTATTDDVGNYSLSPSAGASDQVRIEFELPLGCTVSKAIDFEAHQGINHGTSVQFITGAPSTVNFAIYSPQTEYLETNNPSIYTTVYNAGNPTNASTKFADALLGFKQTYEGIPGDTLNGMPGKTRPSPTRVAYFGDIGTTWGIAYSKHCQKIFSAAFMKRYAGLGPLGSGGIYMIDPSQPTNSSVNNFLSLDTDLNIPTQGTGVYTAHHPGFSPIIGTNEQRKLKGITDLSTDAAAFGQVGKVSLGGLELSEDGRYLFVVNLYDRKIYRLDLKDAKNPQKPSATDVKVYNDVPWLSASCASGVARPFGIKFYKGKIYAGVVCTGENLGKSVEQWSADVADQVASAKVYEISPEGTGAGTAVLDIPLNYAKNLASKFDNGLLRGWFNWTDDFKQITYSHGSNDDSTYAHPQPILCDIEFDIDGSMITSFADRAGHQMGWRNFKPTTDTISKISCTVSGEIFRAWKNPTTCSFELENNGTAGPYTTAGANKPFSHGAYSGTGEYYFGDDAYTLNNTQPSHGESVIGGLTLSPATGEVIAAAFDPLDGRAGKTYEGIANGLKASFSGGAIRLHNTTGDKLGGYSLYTATGFGKAAGIGDMEIISQFAPISFGNRVWDDADADGVQDADEIGFDGIKLDLYKGTLKVGEAITSSGGQWYFDSTNVILNGVTGIEPLTNYKIKIDTALFKNTGLSILTNYFLTKKDQKDQGIEDVADSDAVYEDGEIVVNVKTGDLGYTNYSLDIGLTQNPPCSFINTGLDSIQANSNATLQDTTDDFISFVLNPSGLNMWITYDVSVSNGSISPNSGNMGEITRFQLQNGSAGGGDIIVTIRNPFDTSCKLNIIIEDPGFIAPYACPDTSYSICSGETFRLEIENTTFTQVQWFVDNGNGKQPINGANGITYDATEPGTYTYEALDTGGCPASQCCPIILKLGANCCKPKICGPVKIKRK